MRTIAITITLTAAILADEPKKPVEPIAPEVPVEVPIEIIQLSPSGDKQTDEARQLVMTKIALRLTPKRALFSRSVVPMALPQFDPVQFVKEEKRLPFTIKDPMKAEVTLASGYVRLSDKKIFILDAATKKHIPYTQDPRFEEPRVEQPAPEKPKART